MTEQPGLVTDSDVAPDTTPEAFVPIDPFLDDEGRQTSQAFEVTKPVMLVQLQDEIEAKVDQDVQVSTAIADPSREPGKDNVLTLFVSPESVDGRTVRGCIDSHVPRPDYGLTGEQRDARSLVDKINSGETLSPEEVTQALQLLLRTQTG